MVITNEFMTKPPEITCEGKEYLDWCARDKAGEVKIMAVISVPNRNGLYKLRLNWPEKPIPIQTNLL